MTATLCSTIDTLAMVYLDDELADEERREVELHLHDCPSCAERLATERKVRGALRAALAPPPAPQLLRARIMRGLDEIDRTQSRATWKRLLLPVGSMSAGAAALVLFFVMPQTAEKTATNLSGREVVRVQTSEPLAVAARSGGTAELRGARLLRLMDDTTAVQLGYVVTQANGSQHHLQAFVLKGVDPGELAVGVPYEVGGKTLYVTMMDGPNGTFSTVSYTDVRLQRGYIFKSYQLTPDSLLDIVERADLIQRCNEGR